MSVWMDMAYDAGYRGDEQREYAYLLEQEAYADYHYRMELADEEDEEFYYEGDNE